MAEYIDGKLAVPGATYKFSELPVGAAFKVDGFDSLQKKIDSTAHKKNASIVGLNDGIEGRCEPGILVIYCVVRERRGKWVEVPPEWVGKVPSKSRMKARNSKMTPKERRYTKTNQKKGGGPYVVPGSREAEEQAAIEEQLEEEKT